MTAKRRDVHDRLREMLARLEECKGDGRRLVPDGKGGWAMVDADGVVTDATAARRKGKR